jgi:two-component system, NtrC family, nitrogen regulation response regulator NtrX
MASVLIVDDEPNIRRMLAALLAGEGYEVRDAPDGESGVAAAAEVPPDAVLLDLMMPGHLDGLATLARLRDRDPELPVIMMSGRAGLSDAVRATKLGAFNFLEKPLSPESVLLALITALDLRQARKAARALREELGLTGQMVGASAPMRAVAELIARVAPSDARVLINGESGTGKELVAAAIHEASPRRDRPFVRVNCAAIPRDLVESEMFGHERGSFTGATTRRIGRFEMAHTGTLLLDEVGDLGAEAQAKLLRAIEANEIERIGGAKPIRIDVRIIAATNKDLPRAVSEGAFREDLYFRLNVIPLNLPSLRERAEDIPALVQHFTVLQRARTGRALVTWSPEAVSLMAAYRWPGNVRELANIVERLAILHAGEVITPRHVHAVLPIDRDTPAAPFAATLPDGRRRHTPSETGTVEISQAHTSSLASGTPLGQAPLAAAPLASATLAGALDAYERELITRALAAADGNVTEAARRLETDRPNLYRRMRRLGIALGTVLACAAAAALTALIPARAWAQDTTAHAPAAADTGAKAGPDSARDQPDTIPAPADDWWHRWLLGQRPPNYVGFGLSSEHTYNRVEGFPIYLGPTARHVFPWGAISGDADGIVRISDKLRWDEDHIGYATRAELRIGPEDGQSLTLGTRLYDIITPVESWGLNDAEVGLSTFFLHRDYRDYFARHGVNSYAALRASDLLRLTVSYADERWATRPVRDPFTLFDNTAGWRANPQVDDGLFRLVTAHAVFDSRNDPNDPWSGWYGTADVEHGDGNVSTFGPRTDGETLSVPAGGISPVQYWRGFFDGRRYNRVGPDEQLNLRLVLAGWLGGDQLPLERRLSLGGAGTMPGFDFRNTGTGPDVAACSTSREPPPGNPAQCDRIAMVQAEFRHDIRVGLADFIRGVPRDGAWILFADAGRGWLVGPHDSPLQYPSDAVPGLGTSLADAGAGITLGPFGVYVAQAISPWNYSHGPKLAIRLQQRF